MNGFVFRILRVNMLLCLRVGDSTLYDTTDADNDFDENELLQSIEARKEVFTQFDTDKLKEFSKPFNE